MEGKPSIWLSLHVNKLRGCCKKAVITFHLQQPFTLYKDIIFIEEKKMNLFAKHFFYEYNKKCSFN